MNTRPPQTWGPVLAVLLAAGFGLVLTKSGCNRHESHQKPPAQPGASKDYPMPPGQYSIDLFKAEPRLGTAVVVLVDTSGSMAQDVKDRGGQRRPKYQIAHNALENVIKTTAAWKKAHPQANLQMAIYSFNSSVGEVLPMGDFDEAKAQAALNRLPPPNSGTAIGKALEAGFKALYRSGCTRKFVVCVTDGENTTGPAPDWIARHLHARTEGEVELQFIAFDTAASQFQFLKQVNGHVVQADDGTRLQAELEKVYQERILVEKEEPEKK